MKRKQIYLTLGTLASVALPLAASVSCGTSWQHWNSSSEDVSKLTQDPLQTNRESYDPNTPKPDNNTTTGPITVDDKLWKVRDISELNKALDVSTNTIDLNQLKNQFELNKLLISIIGLKAPNSLETYWEKAKWSDLITYINGIKDKVDINLKYKDQTQAVRTQKFSWDLGTSKQAIIDGINGGGKSFVDIDKARDVNSAGDALTDAGFEKAKNAAVDMMNIPIVKAIVKVYDEYAGRKLAMLVNLPLISFNAFKELLNHVSDFTNEMFATDAHDQFTNTLINSWISENKLNAKLNIHNLNSPERLQAQVIDGAFMLQALSTEFDNLK